MLDQVLKFEKNSKIIKHLISSNDWMFNFLVDGGPLTINADNINIKAYDGNAYVDGKFKKVNCFMATVTINVDTKFCAIIPEFVIDFPNDATVYEWLHKELIELQTIIRKDVQSLKIMRLINEFKSLDKSSKDIIINCVGDDSKIDGVQKGIQYNMNKTNSFIKLSNFL